MAIWNKSHVYTAGQTCTNLDAPAKLYTCATGGTSAPTGVGPTGTGSSIADGSVVWNYTSEAPVLQTNCSHIWHLDGNSVDSLGGPSTDTAMTYGVGQVGGCGVFNGSTSVITTTTLGPSGANSRTISFWMKANAATIYRVLAYGAATTQQLFEFVQVNANMYIDTYGVNWSFGVVTAGIWNHVVATYDGATLYVYINGVQGTPVTTILTTAATGPLLIGQSYQPSYPFAGSLDDVRMWSRALSIEECQSMYLMGRLSRLD